MSGPKIDGIAPIVVVFENISDKEIVWKKIKENPRVSKVVVTQFDSNKLEVSKSKSQNQQDKKEKVTGGLQDIAAHKYIKQNMTTY